MNFLIQLLALLIVIVAIGVLVVVPWPVLAALVLVFAAWMGLTRSGRQAWSVTRVGLATIPQRLGASSVVVGTLGNSS